MGKRAVVVNGRIVNLNPITEADLLKVETLRARVVLAKRSLEGAEIMLASAEAEIMAKLDAGCKVERNSALSAGISEETGPRRPEWKEIYLNHMEHDHGSVREYEEKLILDTTAGKPKQVLRIFHSPKGRLS